MNERIDIQSHWTVDEVLRHKPEASYVFVRRGMQCVGCFIQKFCSVKSVAEIYNVNLEELLKNLNEYKVRDQNIINKEK